MQDKPARGPFSLVRLRDGAGDSGQMSEGYEIINDEVQRYQNCRPRLGLSMRVGSLFARTYSAQDWWQTTFITEIISETDTEVMFRTGNSIYKWTCSPN